MNIQLQLRQLVNEYPELLFQSNLVSKLTPLQQGSLAKDIITFIYDVYHSNDIYITLELELKLNDTKSFCTIDNSKYSITTGATLLNKLFIKSMQLNDKLITIHLHAPIIKSLINTKTITL